MYLSRVALDMTRRSTMSALSNPQQFHGAVESAFPGERRRRLWRLDRLDGKLYLLILSEDRPNLSGVAAQFGSVEAPATKAYDPLLERIGPESVWQFRLTANPTKSNHSHTEPTGKRIVQAHVTVEYQKQWLLDRAEKHGFHLEPDGFTVTRSQWFSFCKRESKRPVSLLSVTYEGSLTVTDPALFRQLLTEGIGRGKAYGLGLMTVMRRR